jgi:hypothetical protein
MVSGITTLGITQNERFLSCDIVLLVLRFVGKNMNRIWLHNGTRRHSVYGMIIWDCSSSLGLLGDAVAKQCIVIGFYGKGMNGAWLSMKGGLSHY